MLVEYWVPPPLPRMRRMQQQRHAHATTRAARSAPNATTANHIPGIVHCSQYHSVLVSLNFIPSSCVPRLLVTLYSLDSMSVLVDLHVWFVHRDTVNVAWKAARLRDARGAVALSGDSVGVLVRRGRCIRRLAARVVVVGDGDGCARRLLLPDGVAKGA